MDKEILEYVKYGAWFILGSGLVLEITPIKFNPISFVLNLIGKKLNKDVEDKIQKIDVKVDKVQLDLQTHKVESQRRDILNFADELMQNQKKTKENFVNIISLHDKYEKYINDNNIENGQVDLAFEYISAQYKECMNTNGFYTGK